MHIIIIITTIINDNNDNIIITITITIITIIIIIAQAGAERTPPGRRPRPRIPTILFVHFAWGNDSLRRSPPFYAKRPHT